MLTLLLIRHATTAANEAGLWIGQMESEISEKGRIEIENLKKLVNKWSIDKAFVSPSRRALETAQNLLEERVSLEAVEALREINFGVFEGKSFKWAQVHRPEEVEKMIVQRNAYCYPEGESLTLAHERVAVWLNSWLSSNPTGTYMICAHGGTIRSILSELIGHNESLHWHFKIDPASLSVVSIEGDFAVIETLNQR